MKYAIIQTGGKQYKVKKGDLLKIEKINAPAEGVIEIKEVLATFDAEGRDVAFGTPFVEKTTVKALVKEQGRAKKVVVEKFKPKIRYHKKYGHRQPYTKIEITDIVG